MAETRVKIISLVFFVLLFCFSIYFSYVQFSSKRTEKQLQETLQEIEITRSEIQVVNEENIKLREAIRKANEIVEKAINDSVEAQDKHEERIHTIENDKESSDWLSCPVPNVVRDAFKDYCED